MIASSWSLGVVVVAAGTFLTASMLLNIEYEPLKFAMKRMYLLCSANNDIEYNAQSTMMS